MIMLEPQRCIRWLREVFGPSAEHDVEERGLRFGEEAIELIQALGITEEQANALVSQVFSKEPGEVNQELGGTMVTLATLCAVTGLNAGSAYYQEFQRCDSQVVKDKIRAKHNTKAVVSSNFAQRRQAPTEPEASIASIASIDR